MARSEAICGNRADGKRITLAVPDSKSNCLSGNPRSCSNFAKSAGRAKKAIAFCAGHLHDGQIKSGKIIAAPRT
jgi:hypothetical protein